VSSGTGVASASVELDDIYNTIREKSIGGNFPAREKPRSESSTPHVGNGYNARSTA
jgi:hypothetical protein